MLLLGRGAAALPRELLSLRFLYWHGRARAIGKFLFDDAARRPFLLALVRLRRHVSLNACRGLIRCRVIAVCLVLLILFFHVGLHLALLRLLLLLEFLLEHAALRAHLSFSFLAVS